MRKKLLLLFTLIICFSTLSAQQISLNVLLEAAACKEKICFRNIAEKQKFVYANSANNQFGTMHYFLSDRRYDKNTVEFGITFFKANTVLFATVAVMHGIEDYFLNMLKQAADLGFTSKKMLKDAASIVGSTEYSNTGYPKLLLVTTVKKDDKGNKQFVVEIRAKN